MTNIRFQIVSDLHINFRKSVPFHKYLYPVAENTDGILCICGDICEFGISDNWEQLAKFFEYISKNWKIILIVFGNHEFYSFGQKKIMTMDDCKEKAKKMTEQYRNIHFLERSTFKIMKGKQLYIFAGGTLYFPMPSLENRKKIETEMVDFDATYIRDYEDCVRRFRLDDADKLYKKTVEFVKKQMSKASKKDAKLILMFHHKPHKSNLKVSKSNTDKENRENSFEQAYESDLQLVFNEPVMCVNWGHTHESEYKKINKVLSISNSLGYPKEHTGYNPELVISV
jgi:predicted phosphodiesterase